MGTDRRAMRGRTGSVIRTSSQQAQQQQQQQGQQQGQQSHQQLPSLGSAGDMRLLVVDVGDKPFPFALLPKRATVLLARMLGLIDLSRFREVSMWHKNFSDEYLPGCWVERLRMSYPLLAMTIEVRRRGAGKQELLIDDELDPRKAYMAEVIQQFEADPEAVNPFDRVAVLLLYHHYKTLVHAGTHYLSLHNFSVLVALHLKIRHGIFRTEQAMADVDAIIAARFVDKLGKLKKMLEQKWQSLVIDTETLIVSAELKLFEKSMRRAYFMKLQYVMYVSSLPYFPHYVTECKLVQSSRRKTKDMLIGINREGILLIDEKSNQTTEAYLYARLVSWAYSKEMFSFRYVSERGASRRGAEEVIVITPDGLALSEAVQKQVASLEMLGNPWGATMSRKEKVPRLMDEYMQGALQQAKSGGKSSGTLDHSQEKRLRQLSQLCGGMAESSRQYIRAARTKKNYDDTLEMKKKTIAYLAAVNKVDAALRLMGTGKLDVTTTVRLTSAIKAFVDSVESIAGEDTSWRVKMEAIVKRVEEN